MFSRNKKRKSDTTLYNLKNQYKAKNYEKMLNEQNFID